jgi:transposase
MMARLSERERNQAIGMLRGGVSVVNVSGMFNCSGNTVHKLVRRYRLTGDVHDRPRPGRPRATTQRDDRAIV